MIRLLRSSFVIARRDFAATVLSKAFIFFLLGPLFPLLLGGVFGSIGARVATQTARPVVAVVMMPNEAAQLAAARDRLADALGEQAVVQLVYFEPEKDVTAQQKRLLASSNPPIRAVLTGWFGNPRISGDVRPNDPTVRQLDLILSDALMPPSPTPQLDIAPAKATSGSLAKERAFTGQIGQMLLFFLTILLAGMVMSQLIEEKSNKIVEVIAAAVPIDAMFIGKLFAMLSASVLGIIVWVSVGAILIDVLKQGGVATLAPPAVGGPP
jgi:ABC-2 type transport system permease protein